jgi:intracellular multiplication protein IcmS
LNIGKKLALITREMQVAFTLNSKDMPAEEVFAEVGLLPAIIRRADQLCSFCLGYGLGITFEESSGARLGVKVKFDDTIPDSLRLMCAVEILYELVESSPNRQVVALDDLMYD